MKYWLGVTDNKWFSFQEKHRFDEVNFWQPSATPPFKNAPEGMPFLFKLKKPYNHIVGGGFFIAYSSLPIKMAWETFGTKNGVNSFSELHAIIAPLTGGNKKNNDIGCTILTNPFFFNPSDWIETPSSFSSNIVRGKMYDTLKTEGAELWNMVIKRLDNHREFITNLDNTTLSEKDILETAEKYGTPYLTRSRIGQGSFRLLVTDAYKRRCAITGESTLPVLEAAHIIPYAEGGTHDISNGLLLRSDFHKLYDLGLISITPDYKVKVSSNIRESWFNGKAYYRLQDQSLASIPDNHHHKPNRDFLDWHFKNRFIT